MTRLRFGVVGCGAIVTLHQLPALARCPALELVGVSDLDAGWAAQVARRFRVPRAFGDHRALIGSVDAVLVATPNTTHAAIASTFLEAGVHVLCEKPMATTRADADRMLAAAESGRARLMAGHCLRFSPNLALLRQLVSEGLLGQVERITGAIGAPYDAGAQRTDFRRQKRLAGGGALMDLGVHLLDLALWMAPGSTRIHAYRGSSLEGWEVESDADVSVTVGDALEVSIRASFTQLLDNTLTVRGTDGWARASLYAPTELTLHAPAALACRRAGMQRLVLPERSMYDEQIAHFCRAVLDGSPFVVTGDQVRRTLDVIDACYLREAA